MSIKYATGRDDIIYVPATTLYGGLWMGDESSKPTVMVNVLQPNKVHEIMNFYTVMAGGVGISSSFFEFATTQLPPLTDFKALIFIIYYGLIMAW